MTRKICVFTGTRAEYGLLKPLIRLIQQDSELELQLLVTGAHLSHDLGFTCEEIAQDGFPIAKKVDILSGIDVSDATGMAQVAGRGLAEFSQVLVELKPDLIVVLGDRYEALSAVFAALLVGVPVAHLNGGELTEGVIDDAIRHAMTKMSHLHFTATEIYRNRVIQLGEVPEFVFNVGEIGLDDLAEAASMNREAVEADLGIKLRPESYLVTHHPVTLDPAAIEAEIDALLLALHQRPEASIIFTRSNADAGAEIIHQKMESFVAEHADRSQIYSSLGRRRYLSAARLMTAVVGNSSSGIVEVPSLKVATVNIGDRQKGRLQAASVINCESTTEAISSALVQVNSESYRDSLPAVKNPYYQHGGSARRTVEILKTVTLDGLRRKTFFDLEGFSCDP